MAVCVWNVKPAPIPNAPLPNRASRVKALSPRSDVAGVVLAGGLGRRMGRDKTGLRLREGEADFVSRAAALLARVVVDVRVGCRADQAERAARAGRPLTPDLTPGGGVLCAVQSCLRHLERPCLVIPCDMPFLTEGVLLALLAARDEGLAAGCPPGVTLFQGGNRSAGTYGGRVRARRVAVSGRGLGPGRLRPVPGVAARAAYLSGL